MRRRVCVIGLAPSDLDDERFRELARESLGRFSRTGLSEKLSALLAPRLAFVRLDEDGYARRAGAGSGGREGGGP